MRIRGCNARHDRCQSGRVAAAQDIHQDGVEPRGVLFSEFKQPILKRHQQGLEDVWSLRRATVEAPEPRIGPLLLCRPVCEGDLNFPRWFQPVMHSGMRVPVGAVIEDLDDKVQRLARVKPQKMHPRAAYGAGRIRVVPQSFLDTEIQIEVERAGRVAVFPADIRLRREEVVGAD